MGELGGKYVKLYVLQECVVVRFFVLTYSFSR